MSMARAPRRKKLEKLKIKPDDKRKNNRGGRPKGSTNKLNLAERDLRKQNWFAKYINRHCFKSLPELDKVLKDKELSALEIMAVQTIIKAARQGLAIPIELVLSTSPDSVRVSRDKMLRKAMNEKLHKTNMVKREREKAAAAQRPPPAPEPEVELPAAGEFAAEPTSGI